VTQEIADFCNLAFQKKVVGKGQGGVERGVESRGVEK
jgi:hypothetical protein